MRFWFVLAALLASQPALAQTGATQSAFEAGKSLGQGKNQGAFSGIAAGSAQDKIPRYGASAPEASYFAGGKGETSSPGIGKMQSCASYTPGSDKIANQECEAVNLLARNPNVRPRFNIGQNDPMMQKYKQLRDNAEQSFAQFFPGGTGSQGQCVTRNETTPGQYSTETCVSAQEVGTDQCTMGRIINIDTDANFQCEQTINAYESLKCRRSAQVSTTLQTTCTPGQTVVAEQASSLLGGDPCWGGDKLVFSYTCEATDNPKIDIHILRDVYGSFPWSDPATHHQYGLPLTFSYTTNFSNCQADVTGSTSCTNGLCLGNYQARISYCYTDMSRCDSGVAYYDGGQYAFNSGGYVPHFGISIDLEEGGWGSGGGTWYYPSRYGAQLSGPYTCYSYGQICRYSGSLYTSAQFRTYSASATLVGWGNGCAALEQRAQ